MAYLNRSIRKQFLFDEETVKKLKTLSEDKKISENEIVNRALAAYLKRFTFDSDNSIDTININAEVIK